MTLFCPNCTNLLVVEQGGSTFFKCNTCPYKFEITQPIIQNCEVKKKEEDAVMGEEQWKNAQTTNITCEKCGNGKAFFFQIQIRSADEPMTTFYRCTNFDCGYQWRDG